MIALPAAALPAAAAEAPEAGSALEVAAYLWASGFGGTIRPSPGAPTVRISRSFGEPLEDLDAAVFASGLARRGRLVAVADASHASSARAGLVPTPIPGLPAAPAEGQLRQTSLMLLLGLRPVARRDVSIDLLGGLRTFWIRTAVEVPALGVQRSPTASLTQPILAARINAQVAGGLSILAYGDVGGLGVGSELTTQAVAMVNTRLLPRTWLSLGYRYLMVDEDGQRLRADVHLAGPLLGVTLAF